MFVLLYHGKQERTTVLHTALPAYSNSIHTLST